MDEMSEIKLIMKDTDERLANLTISPPDNRIKFEDGRPEKNKVHGTGYFTSIMLGWQMHSKLH